MIYAPATFEVATSNGSGGGAFTRNMKDGRTDVQRDDGPTLIRNYLPFFLKKKTGILI